MYSAPTCAVVASREKLLVMLNDAEKAIFQKYLDANAELRYLDEIEDFVLGYKLGLQMTAEAFINKL